MRETGVFTCRGDAHITIDEYLIVGTLAILKAGQQIYPPRSAITVSR